MSNGKLSLKRPSIVAEPKEMRILDPKDLGSVWDRVLIGLKRVQARSNRRDWRPEDIYASIKTGNSILLYDPHWWRGFLICTKTESFLGTVLWIWMAYGERSADIAWYWERLNDFAKEEGVTAIHFSSDRVGWARVAKKYGCKAFSIIYEKQVT